MQVGASCITLKFLCQGSFATRIRAVVIQIVCTDFSQLQELATMYNVS
jgi:hypothetical protein